MSTPARKPRRRTKKSTSSVVRVTVYMTKKMAKLLPKYPLPATSSSGMGVTINATLFRPAGARRRP